MMSTKRQKERKKKAREGKAKARVIARRHKLDVARRDEARSSLLGRKFREKIEPIVKDPEKKRAIEEASAKKTEERLRRNAEILRALEEEYIRDKEQKKALNETLESDGHSTLKDKLGAMEADARAQLSGDAPVEDGSNPATQD